MNGEQNQAAQPAGLPPEPENADAAQPQPVPQPSSVRPPEAEAAGPAEPATPAGGFFHNEDAGVAPAGPPAGHDAQLEWTAADTGARPKPSGWLAMIIGGAVAAALVIYQLTKDAFSAGAIVAAALLFVAFSSHKPRALRYRVDAAGITIGSKRYPYSYFRSFSVVDDEAVHNIMLMPLKRFMPILTLNYTPEIETSIVGVLADRLPMEAHRRDALDAVINKLRF